MAIFHGSSDKSIPVDGSELLVQEGKWAGIPSLIHVYDKWSHTDGILEKIFSGDTLLVEDIVQVMHKIGTGFEFEHGEDNNNTFKSMKINEEHILYEENDNWPIVYPRVLVFIARFFNPF
jgi:hypothetical protein